MVDNVYFEKALQRDIDTLLQALLDPTFKFSNVSSFVEAFDPILKSDDHYACYLKRIIQASVFYYYLLMLVRVSKNTNIVVAYPFNRIKLTDQQKLQLTTVFNKFKVLLQSQPIKDILLKELTILYKDLMYNKDDKDLTFNINAVWNYLLEVGVQQTSLNISELHKQRTQAQVVQNKKVTNFTITEDMFEDEKQF